MLSRQHTGKLRPSDGITNPVRYVLVFVSALAVAALAQTKGSNVMHPTVHQRAQVVLLRMHHYNQAQIRMGELAAKQASNAKVCRLGQLIVNYHRLAEKKVRQVAARNALGLNGPLPSSHVVRLAAPPGPPLPPLEQARGSQFNAEFLQRVVRQDAFELGQWTKLQAFVRVSRLRDLIHDMIPIVEQEQALAVRLRNTKV